MNEEQRKQQNARVAVLADAAVDSWADANFDNLRAEVQARINLALDEQAKQIAAAIQTIDEGWGSEHYCHGRETMRDDAAKIAAGFGDDR